MKLISLNAWAGRSLYPFMRFLGNHREDTDIFCFQEVLDANQAEIDRRYPREYACASLFQKICDALPEHRGWFAQLKDDSHQQSVATFVRNSVRVSKVGGFSVYSPLEPMEIGGFVISKRKAQYVMVHTLQGTHMIVNLHGLWTGGEKTDTEDRITQSRIVKGLIREGMRSIVCGDFNLLPDTESMRILEKGMRNLVTEVGIQSTRTPLYRHFDDPAYPNFADYALVGRDIAVSSFRVLPDIVSDHSPLALEFI